MIIKYKKRIIQSKRFDILTFAWCINNKGNKIGQTMSESKKGHKGAIKEMKRLIDRAIHYNYT